MDPVYRIAITPEGHRALRALKDRKVRGEVAKAIDQLACSPRTLGKALEQELEGYRSMKAVRNRIRVLYRIDPLREVVTVIWVGERKPGREDDVYVVAKRLLKTFLR